MLARVLHPFENQAYALMRIAFGLMFSFHGAKKIFGIFSDGTPPVGSQIWIGGVIELVTGIAIAAGSFTTFAAFLASGTMAVAYTQFHWKLQLGSGLLPAVNKGELALVYSLAFLFIACKGPGIWRIGKR